ncbi:MAG TPA: cache domain-containing protein, partial [Rubrivivax sp.]|nr:cache domain-containing protein [Rubrivivax sp.]
MQAQSAFDGTHQRVRREAWIWAFASAALAAALLAWAAASRANLLQRERDRLSGQARAAELNLARNLEGAHAALRFVSDEARRWPAGQLANALSLQMQALRNAMPGVHALQWIDAGGQVLASSQAEPVGQGMAQAAVLRRLQEGSDPSLLMVAELPVSGGEVHLLVLALAIEPSPTGLAGAVVATLDAGFFGTALGSVRYADDMQA